MEKVIAKKSLFFFFFVFLDSFFVIMTATFLFINQVLLVNQMLYSLSLTNSVYSVTDF